MIRAIETAYDGRLFRSRAEARWAAFFKALGLVYEYEPEGVELNGRRYLPDFRLMLSHAGNTFPLWIEVKPAKWNDDSKLEEFAQQLPYGHRATQLPSVEVYAGIVANRPDGLPCWFEGDYGSSYCDTGFLFCACPDCGSVGFEKFGHLSAVGCCGQPSAGSWENPQHDGPAILNAFRFAFSQRFGT